MHLVNQRLKQQLKKQETAQLLAHQRAMDALPTFLGIPLHNQSQGDSGKQLFLPEQLVKGNSSDLQRSSLGLLKAYVSYEDYHYRVVDSVLPLDSCGLKAEVPLEMGLGPWRDGVCSGRVTGDTDFLRQLAQEDLFDQVTEQYRGGARLIFRSQKLSRSIQKALRSSGVAFPTDSAFKRVNQVFRLNRFQPGDAQFKAHYDVPFVNSRQSELSLFTMLIYLTPGEGQKTLCFQQFSFDSLNKDTVVIFDIKKLHSGRPFSSTTKLFIRTDLIFDCKASPLAFSVPMSNAFNSACYFALYSNVFKAKYFDQRLQEAVAGETTRLFQKHCAYRFAKSVSSEDSLCIFKRLQFMEGPSVRQAVFVTNGAYYLFPSNAGLFDSCMYAICDYFNSFPCTSSEIKFQHCSLKEAAELLRLEISSKLMQNDDPVHLGSSSEEIGYVQDCDCGSCQKRVGDALRYEQEQKTEIVKKENYNILLFGTEVLFRKDQMRVIGSSVYFSGVDFPDSWNFASCQGSFRYNQMSLEGEHVKAAPITFSRAHNCLILCLDTYSNGLVQKERVQMFRDSESQFGIVKCDEP